MPKKILFIFSLFIGLLTTSLLTAASPASNLAPEIFPLQATKAELTSHQIILDWSEETTVVKDTYNFFNPQEKKIKLKIGLQLPTSEKKATLQVFTQEKEITTSYQRKNKIYLWEMELEPQTTSHLTVYYELENNIDEAGLSTLGYQFASEATFADEQTRCSLQLNFNGTQPGQIKELAPADYYFENEALLWSGQPLTAKIIITANLTAEKEIWLNLLTAHEKNQLNQLDEQAHYQAAFHLLEKAATQVNKTENKQAFLLGQAYYLKKAGDSKKALQLFNDLVNNEAPFPRAYWELGQSYEQHIGKLTTLFNQIQEEQIHALLQAWLIAQLPPEKTKKSPPEITIKYAETNESRHGILIKSCLTDKDGDLTTIKLRYHWEGEPEQEINFPTHPFQYDYELLYFTLAPNPFKQLFYEFIVTDATGHEVSSGIKEAFYLNKDIQSQTFILKGANLILGGYTPTEQSKVYKWFRSYLKMAHEADFVPLKAKSPLFIFMGEKHSFFESYSGPLFFYHTTTPFNPEATRIPVHRYFLGSWYGPGWHTLSLKELAPLGDALLLNKGWLAQVLAYLQNKDQQRFSQLLGTIGAGENWTSALATTYNLTPFKLNLLTIWHLSGNYILAICIIITFAWLGKKGYLNKLLQK